MITSWVKITAMLASGAIAICVIHKSASQFAEYLLKAGKQESCFWVALIV